MKHVKIVLALTTVVVVMMVAVFFVEDSLRGDINLAAAERANLAKDEVLEGAAAHPVAVLNALEEDETLDVGTTGITGIYHYEGLGYVYQAEFLGFASTISYMVGFDELGNVTGYKTLSQNDSPGYGAKIGDPETWEQLNGLTISDLESGNFDGIAGATFTTNGWKDSFNAVIGFHNNVFLGIEIVDVTTSMSHLPSSVTMVEEVQQNGTAIEYIYTVEFYGYNTTDASVFKVTIDLDSEVQGVEIVTVNETDGIGSHIADPEFVQQFIDMSVEDATDNNYDDLGGATYPATLFGFQTSFTEAYMYHRVEVEGYVPHIETPEEELARWYIELSNEDALTDTTGDYDLGSSFVEKVEENDDFVILTATFPGFIDDMTIMVGFNKTSNNVSGLRVLVNNETNGYGSKASEDDFMNMFTDMNHILAMYGQFDSIGGATLTSNAVRDGLWNIVEFYRVAFMGVDPIVGTQPTLLEMATEQAEVFYPGFSTITDVTTSNPADHLINGMYEIKDGTDTVLGYIFAVEGEGANIAAADTVNKFFVAINVDKTFQGVQVYESNDTAGYQDSYLLEAYGLQYVGTDVEISDYGVDSTAGATFTGDAVEGSVRDAAKYYIEEVLGLEFARPASQTTANGNLQAAYPTAASFTEEYLSFPFDDGIRNIYAARDGSNNIIGYVYYGFVSGGFLNVEYTWGVDNSGLTQELYIITDGTSWDFAPDYSGGEDFNTSTFLDLYAGIQIDSILDTQVNIDSWSGVSTTTGGMRAALELIAQYHEDNNVGGGN